MAIIKSENLRDLDDVLFTLHEDQYNSKGKNSFHLNKSILYVHYVLHLMGQVQK